MKFLADALNVPVTRLIDGPARPTARLCVFCRQLPPAPGDIYCEGCRSAITRELSEYAADQRAYREALDADITVLRGHAIAAALAKARPELDAPGAAVEAWRQCCRQVSVVVCNDDFSISRFYALCGLDA